MWNEKIRQIKRTRESTYLCKETSPRFSLYKTNVQHWKNVALAALPLNLLKYVIILLTLKF